MPRAVRLSDGTTGMFDDNATDAEIDEQLRRDGLTRVIEPSVAAQPTAPVAAQPTVPSRMDQFVQAMKPEAGGAAALSLLNSLGFGLPEMAARAVGAGPAINQLRQEYPMATTGGEVAGLVNPARMGMNMLRNLTTRAMPATGVVPGVARAARDVGGATLGAQAAYSQLGAAARPDDPMAGAMTNAAMFQRAAQSLPLNQIIPGSQGVIGSATGIVPGLLGMADLGGRMAATNFQDIERARRIKEEAARRALQGQR